MAGFLGEDQVRKVKEAIDLVEVMGDYATMQRAGSQFRCCCPFHQERTPSCYVYPDQQTYHCYGCGAHGDVITLVREQEGFDFTDAMRFLARRAGIDIQFEERQQAGPSRSERERLQAAMAFATSFYERCLRNDDAAEARDYLKGRAITGTMAQAFRLGWAPGRGALVDAARQAGHDPRSLIEANLAIDREGRIADRFYERIIFPICDRFGNPIAFTARVLPEAERAAKEAGRGLGKYINTNDTPLYHKSDVVFNLHRARSAVRTEGRLIVMEGPTDVMAAHGAGLDACVAVLGTAMTNRHARQLGNLVGSGRTLFLLFDGDQAGQNNSVKAVATCIAAGVPCQVAVLPSGHDPAELLAERGRAGFDEILSSGRPDIDHLLRAVAPLPHTLDPRAQLDAIDRVLEALRPVKDRDLREGYLELSAEWFKVEGSRLRRRLAGDEPEELPEDSGPPLLFQPDPVEDLVLQLLIREPQLREQAGDVWELEPALIDDHWRPIAERLLLEPEVDGQGLLLDPLVRDDPPRAAALHRWLREGVGMEGQSLADPDRLCQEAIATLRTRWVDNRIEALQNLLTAAQREGDHVAAGQLFGELMELQRGRRGS